MKAGEVYSSLLQQRLISSPFRGSFSLSPFQVLLIFMFNLTISTSNMLLVSTVLRMWSKLLRSVRFLSGLHSDFWNTFVQVKRSLFPLFPIFKRMLPIMIFASWYSIIIGTIRLFCFYLHPLPNPTPYTAFLEKKTTPNNCTTSSGVCSLLDWSLLSLALGLDCVPCFGKYADVNAATCVQFCLKSGFVFLLSRLTTHWKALKLQLF